jgi:hypothetical protein
MEPEIQSANEKLTLKKRAKNKVGELPNENEQP